MTDSSAAVTPTTTIEPQRGAAAVPPAVEPSSNLRRALLPRLALLLSGLISAGTFIVAKDATARFTPIELTCLRATLSFLIVAPIFFATRRGRRLPTDADVPPLIVLGLLGAVINQMCFLFGISMTRPVHGALLYAFTPVLVLVAAVIWLGERLTGLKVLAVLLALVGVVIVLVPDGLDFSSASFRGDAFIFVAVLAWAAYTLLGKPMLSRLDTFTVIMSTFTVGVVALAPCTVWVLTNLDFARPGWPGWMGLLYLSGMTSGVAFSLWYWALKRMETSQVAIFSNLQPPLTALLAWIFLGNVPDGFIVIGGLLVIAGVSILQWPPRRPRVVAEAAATARSS
jgi:RarD protein